MPKYKIIPAHEIKPNQGRIWCRKSQADYFVTYSELQAEENPDYTLPLTGYPGSHPGDEIVAVVKADQ